MRVQFLLGKGDSCTTCRVSRLQGTSLFAVSEAHIPRACEWAGEQPMKLRVAWLISLYHRMCITWHMAHWRTGATDSRSKPGCENVNVSEIDTWGWLLSNRACKSFMACHERITAALVKAQ